MGCNARFQGLDFPEGEAHPAAFGAKEETQRLAGRLWEARGREVILCLLPPPAQPPAWASWLNPGGSLLLQKLRKLPAEPGGQDRARKVEGWI